MVEGTLKNGFEYKVEDDALDDYELLEDLIGSAEDGSKYFKAAKRLLGEEQHNALKEYCRGEDGRVRATAVMECIEEIFEGCKPLKN